MNKDFLRKIALFFRKKRFARFKNAIPDDVTIISNNCTGGTMYNDLGLKFLSPTINLYFGENKDFYNFVNNLKGYCEKGLLIQSDKKENKKGFEFSPVGLLICESLKPIEIHFLHYKSFEEAKTKWHERVQRINYSKIFLVIEAKTDYEKNMIQSYLSLNYPKVIFTDEAFEDPSCIKMPFYSKYGTGDSCPILKLISLFGKRGYDDFNFVDNIFLKKY